MTLTLTSGRFETCPPDEPEHVGGDAVALTVPGEGREIELLALRHRAESGNDHDLGDGVVHRGRVRWAEELPFLAPGTGGGQE
ncbi:MAG: hypothetical protein R2909_08685 [Gemmatimonadales bacterium]